MRSPRPAAWMLIGVFAAALLLQAPHRLTRSLSAAEVAWLAAPAGLLGRLADGWAGAIASDFWMRMPLLLVGALGAPLTLWALWRREDWRLPVAAALTVGCLPTLVSSSSALGPHAGLAIIGLLGLCAVARGPESPARTPVVLGCVALLLEPSFALIPVTAALALRIVRSFRSMVVLVCLGTALLAALLIYGPALSWGLGNGTRPAQQVLALIALVPWWLLVATRSWTNVPRLSIAALGGAVSCLFWLVVAPMRRVSDAPLTGSLCCLIVAAVALAPATRRLGRLPAMAMALAALLGWFQTDWDRHRALPLGAAITELVARFPETSELLSDPGISRGALRHAGLPEHMRVLARPGADRVARIHPAAVRPAPPEVRRLIDVLGHRVLERYGVAQSVGGSVRWAVYRPVRASFPSSGPRPDIAIVSVDTLRADRMSLYGYERSTSPRLAAWAGKARVFDRAVAPAGETCPSFASVLTGRLPSGHGVRSNVDFLDPGNWSLGDLLRQVGYETAAFVSSSLLYRGDRGLDDGFDHYDDRLDRVEINRPHARFRVAPDLSSAVKRWLSDRTEAERPWFIWVHAMDPHGPYTPLPEYAGSFRSTERRELPRDEIPAYQWLGTTDYHRYHDAYDDEVLQTDAHLGPLIGWIRERESDRGTLVFFLADHGEAFGEHGYYFAHGKSVHEEELHVPLVFEDTRRPASGREPVPVSLVDVVPTVLERLAIETDLPLDGLPLDERVRRRETVVGGWRPGEWAVYAGSLKLLMNSGGEAGGVRVHDLARDPREASPLEDGAEGHPRLLSAALEQMRDDPLAPDVDDLLQRERWESLSPEEIERLKALGYVAP